MTTALLTHLAALAIVAAVGVLVPLALVALKRIKNASLRDALALLTMLIGALVRNAARDVADMKDPGTPSAWGPIEAARIKAGVVASASAIAPAAVAAMARAAANPTMIDATLGVLVESELAKFKAGAA